MNRSAKGRVLVASLACLAVGAVFVPSAGAKDARPLLERAAKGALNEPGGARRLAGDETALIAGNITNSPAARNVVVIIGDGMGDSEITIARNYLKGAGGFMEGLDALPLTGQMTSFSLDKTGKPDYTPDSAATGTAWATGTKSYDGAISVDITGKPLPTLLEWAKQTGRATGDVTTSEVQDATPAVQVAKVTSRSCYGPDETTAKCAGSALENNGLGSISEQLLGTRPDVTFGGGSKSFAQTAKAGEYKGKTLEDQARERGYQYITAKDAMAGITEANQDKPVLGLFSPGNLPVRFSPLIAQPGIPAAAAKCEVNPDFAQVPDLKSMTSKAIDLLSTSKAGKEKGFFLQVESASIDKKDHAADACGQIGETEQIDEAIKSALDFAKEDGNTLVIVTADHAHTSQIVDAPTPGLNAKLTTADGSDMFVSYGTSPAGGSQQHTGSQVRVAAYGPGAANVVGLIDQTDMYFIMKDSMTAWDAGERPTDPPPPTATETVTAPGPTVTAPGPTQVVTAPGPTVTAPGATQVVTAPGPTHIVTAPPAPVDVYVTPGTHSVKGRLWFTACEPYGQTVRCRTDIWTKRVVHTGGKFVVKEGWAFNNLTYLPKMTRQQWGSNPLAKTGTWTQGGRKWRTECDTATTGKNACRSFVWGTVVRAAKGGSGYSLQHDWILNNIVRFK